MDVDLLLVDTGVMGRGVYEHRYPRSFMPRALNVIWNLLTVFPMAKRTVFLWDSDWSWRSTIVKESAPFLVSLCRGNETKYDTLIDAGHMIGDCGFEQASMSGLERTDVAATLCNSNPDAKVLIYSADNRMLPLVEEDRVWVFDPIDVRDFSRYRIRGSDYVAAQFGVHPALLPDILALTSNAAIKKVRGLSSVSAIKTVRSLGPIRTWPAALDSNTLIDTAKLGRRLAKRFKDYVFQNYDALTTAVDFHRPDGVSYSESDLDFYLPKNTRQALYVNAVKHKMDRFLSSLVIREFVDAC